MTFEILTLLLKFQDCEIWNFNIEIFFLTTDSSGAPIVTSITAEEINQNLYTLDEVVLSYPGHGMRYPGNPCMDYMSDILQQDGTVLADIPRRRGDISLVSGYR